MRTTNSESGFTITELIVASMITLAVIGVALTTFSNAMDLNEAATQVADSNQNLRAGTNLLVRDLLQTGRNISTGGISIPSGAGSVGIYRPSPPAKTYMFENVTQTALQSITTGEGLGQEVDGKATDLVTLLMDDGVRDALTVQPSTFVGAAAKLSADGSQLDTGPALAWLTGDPVNGIPAIKEGDLLYFSNAVGTTIQTVTKIQSATIHFETGSADPFRFNQPGAAAGSITQIKGSAMSVRRILMYTYYVHNDSSGTPRLMRRMNMYPHQALAGVIEDLTLSFDMVDGVNNPTNVRTLPYLFAGPPPVTYGASQARKANVHVGVRAEDKSARQQDYIRSHLSTIVDLRNLAFVDRYK
jgi:type II secretory pathway pseudopilin PulG